MKKITLLTVLGTLLLISGCFPVSLNPLYTGKELAFDPALLGLWQGGVSTNDTWNFNRGDGREYKLIYTDEDGKTGRFDAHRLKLGDVLFLDFYPAEEESRETNRSELLKYHFVRVHSFAKLSQSDSALQLSFFSLKWLQELLEKNPEAIRHEKVGSTNDERIVLTASTAELQKFVLKHLETKDAFLEPMNLKRKTAELKKEK